MDEHLLLIVTSWFLSGPDPVVVVDDRNFEILSQNLAADSMFTISTFVKSVDGRIQFSDHQVGNDFRNQVRDWQSNPVAVCCGRGDEDCILAARVDHPIPDAGPHIAILTFRGRVDGKDVSGGGMAWASLIRVFGMTPAEQRVARLLTAGDSVESIAASLGVCVDTVRSHAQKIYFKVGVANREQLTEKLMPLHFSRPHAQAPGEDFEFRDQVHM